MKNNEVIIFDEAFTPIKERKNIQKELQKYLDRCFERNQRGNLFICGKLERGK